MNRFWIAASACVLLACSNAPKAANEDPDAGLTAPSASPPPATLECVPSVCDGVTCDSCQICSCGSCKNDPISLGCCTNDNTSGVSCGNYACNAATGPGKCKTTCTTNADCAPTSGGTTYSCVGSTCVAQYTLGHVCGAPSDCASGNCVDGVCCDSACAGQCQKCSATGKCQTVTTARTPCVGGTGACAAACDGTTAATCTYPKGGSCSAAFCKTDASGFGSYTAPGACDGSGACTAVTTSCAPYACDTSTCKTRCTAGGDCAPGNVCEVSTGICKPIAGIGITCSGPSDCASGLYCVDHVCCATSACPSGTCAYPGALGTCKINQGSACLTDAACASGHCVDGVCCDTACTGQCQACDGAVAGTCSTISGPPHGTRKACPDSGGDPCKVTSCDGAASDHCAKFASGTTCGTQSCSNGTLQLQGSCDGSGGCKLPSATSCGDYQCAGPACGTTCAADSDCTPGRVCQSGKCGSPSAATCVDYHTLKSSAGSVDCSPYTCQGNACLKTCATETDCLGGFSCDASTKTCVAAGTTGGGTSKSGGCSMGRATSEPLWIRLALIGSVLGLRRRALRRNATGKSGS